MLQLDTRKRTVLRAVVEEHIRSAEPVGSHHAAVREHLRVSPATIRSEMAELEELGLLTHPHTSAGRVPTDLGYRVYVDALLESEPLPAADRESVRRRMTTTAGSPGDTAELAAQALASVARYPSVVVASGGRRQFFRSLHIVPLGDGRALAVIATGSGTLHGKTMRLPEGANASDLERLSRAVTHQLQGCRVDDLSPARLEEALREITRFRRWFEEIRSLVLADLAGRMRPQIRVEGARHLLDEPEFSRPERVTGLFEVLEDEALLAEALSGPPTEGVWITIGTENRRSELQRCSVVSAAFRIGDGAGGTVALFGPTRMRYRRAVAAVRYVAGRLSQAMRASF